MSRRGTFYAVTPEEAQQLLSLVGNDAALATAALDLYTMERQRAHFIAGIDKSWDAMHRCLTDGTLHGIGRGTTPLSWCVLGGRNLHAGKEFIVCYVTPEQVEQVSDALDEISVAALVANYRKLPDTDYRGSYGDEDFQYTWDYFTNVRNLYSKAADAGRGVVFVLDQ
jgi:hypothetical protein